MQHPFGKSLNSDFVIVGDTLLNYKSTEKEVHIPEGVSVTRTAFVNQEPNEYAVPVEKVYIPNTVKTLRNGVFIKQENLMIYIPDSVTEIGINEEGEESGLGGDIKIVIYSWFFWSGSKGNGCQGTHTVCRHNISPIKFCI